ncbi:hypothetical protein MMC10_011094 [Thelotrema lepadinum]|nr:hypothetical protein [Thelotrema lepadinum]
MIKWYAVSKGHKIGIFDTWLECLKATNKAQPSRHKSFTTYDEALEWLKYQGAFNYTYWYCITTGERTVCVYSSWSEVEKQLLGLHRALIQGFKTRELAMNYMEMLSKNGREVGWSPVATAQSYLNPSQGNEAKILPDTRIAPSGNPHFDALKQRFDTQFRKPLQGVKSEAGEENEFVDSMETFRRMCRTKGTREPTSERDAWNLLKEGPYVNIIDFIDAAEANTIPQTFDNVRDLARYTARTHRYIDLEHARNHKYFSALLEDFHNLRQVRSFQSTSKALQSLSEPSPSTSESFQSLSEPSPSTSGSFQSPSEPSPSTYIPLQPKSETLQSTSESPHLIIQPLQPKSEPSQSTPEPSKPAFTEPNTGKLKRGPGRPKKNGSTTRASQPTSTGPCAGISKRGPGRPTKSETLAKATRMLEALGKIPRMVQTKLYFSSHINCEHETMQASG